MYGVLAIAVVTRAISGGQPDAGDPAVVALALQGHAFCSGTLIAPRAVLTAAHCVDERSGVVATEIEVHFGADVASSATLRVSVATSAPTWDRATLRGDLALLLLDAAAPVEPVRLRAAPMDDLAGADLRLVGFGATGADFAGVGTKRHAMTRIATVEAERFSYGSQPGQTCVVDSGGPAFIAAADGEQLVGVTSWGDGDCSGLGWDSRVDAYLEGFVLPWLRAHDPGPAADRIAADLEAARSGGGGCTVAQRGGGAGWLVLALLLVLGGLVRTQGALPVEREACQSPIGAQTWSGRRRGGERSARTQRPRRQAGRAGSRSDARPGAHQVPAVRGRSGAAHRPLRGAAPAGGRRHGGGVRRL